MPPPQNQSWKSRLYHQSHNPLVLTKITAGILIAGFLAASVIVTVHGKGDRNHLARLKDIFEARLAKMDPHAPGQNWELAEWTAGVTLVKASSEEKKPSFPFKPSLQRDEEALTPVWKFFDLKKIVRERVGDETLRKRFDDFVAARTAAESPEGRAARKRLEAAAPDAKAAPLASQFLGELLWHERQEAAAMAAFKREGDAWPQQAKHAREAAFAIGVEKEDARMLGDMLTAGYDSDASPYDLIHAGVILKDLRLQAWGYLRLEGSHLRLDELTFVILAGALWYAVFVRFGERDRWRWVRPVPAVLAGVLSIWPTMVLIALRGSHEENGELIHDLVFFITGVGLREEAAKLLLFVPFIPWLLKRRSPGMALLTGAFVGLGFAMEENREYYHSAGIGAVPVARLLTANFLHAGMTGIAAHALYELARTRFGAAEQFIATFVAVVVAHGLYDWVQEAGSDNPTLGNLGMFSIVILALLASQFFDRVAALVQPRRGRVSLNSIFLVGAAVLLAGGFVVAAWRSGTIAAVSDVAVSALSLAPVAVFYSRKFSHL